MARIEINSNDLDLLKEDFANVNDKISELKELIANGFVNERDLELYVNGFDHMRSYLDVLGNDMFDTSGNLQMFNEEMANIEEVFARKFEDIEVPVIEEVTPAVFEEISGGTTVSPVDDPDIPDRPIDDDPEYTETYDDIEEVPLYDMGDGIVEDEEVITDGESNEDIGSLSDEFLGTDGSDMPQSSINDILTENIGETVNSMGLEGDVNEL